MTGLVIRYLKVFVRLMAVGGVVVWLGDLRGWFVERDRQAMYTQLVCDYRVSVRDPGVKCFLDQYYYTKKIPAEMRSEQLKGLLIKFISVGKKSPMAGTVHVFFESGKRTIALCTLEELRQWADETPVHAWVGWWMVAVGLGAAIVIDLVGHLKKKAASRRDRVLG